MKKLIQSYSYFILAFGLMLGLTNCNLKLQEPFEFVPEVPPLTTFKDKTAWAWLQTQKTPDTATTLNGQKFDLFIEAITLTGLEAEFTKAGDQRTFLLLNNGAFTGTGRIVQLLANSTSTTIKKLPTLTDAAKVRLANILKYHIIDAYVDQVNAVPISDAHYNFKTLATAPNDVIWFNRDVRFALTINASPSLPATKRTFTVSRHNYIFQNGIGHILNNYAGIVAF